MSIGKLLVKGRTELAMWWNNKLQNANNKNFGCYIFERQGDRKQHGDEIRAFLVMGVLRM